MVLNLSLRYFHYRKEESESLAAIKRERRCRETQPFEEIVLVGKIGMMVEYFGSHSNTVKAELAVELRVASSMERA